MNTVGVRSSLNGLILDITLSISGALFGDLYKVTKMKNLKHKSRSRQRASLGTLSNDYGDAKDDA